MRVAAGPGNREQLPAAAVAADNHPVRSQDPQVSIQALRDKHRGETAWIVGKGPSLVVLSKEHIGDGPVIAINEAIIAIEALGLDNPLYSMQKDADAYEYDVNSALVPTSTGQSFISITQAALLVHLHESPNKMKDYSPRYVFDNVADFGLEWWEFSSLVAVAIARLMGCSKVVYVSHDACAFGDSRTCMPQYDGSFRVGVDADAVGEYPQHRARIDDYLARVSMPVEWLTPEPGRTRRIDDERQEIERLTSSAGQFEREVRRLTAELAQSEGEGYRLAVALAEAQDKARTLVDALTTAQRESERLTGVVHQRESELHRVADELALVKSGRAIERADLESATRQVDAIGLELRRAHAEIESLSSTTASLRGELDAAARHVSSLLSTRSWRWTAPLRSAHQMLTRTKR